MATARRFPKPLRDNGALDAYLWCVVTLIALLSLAPPLANAGGAGPMSLYWKNASGTVTRPEPIGLLYTPEVLAQLAADRPQDAVSTRIRDAVRDRTPIVVMWSLPTSPEFGSFPRPYRLAIVDQGGDIRGKHVDPLWSDQQADDLRQLDQGTRFEEVGAIAAFPLVAFRRGRLVQIVSSPQQNQGSGVRRAQAWAMIEWDGSRPE